MFILGEFTCTFSSPPPFMDEIFSEGRVKKDNEMGGIIPGGNFLGGNFPGRGDFPGGSLMGGNFPGGSFPGGIFLIPSYTYKKKIFLYDKNSHRTATVFSPISGHCWCKKKLFASWRCPPFGKFSNIGCNFENKAFFYIYKV